MKLLFNKAVVLILKSHFSIVTDIDSILIYLFPRTVLFQNQFELNNLTEENTSNELLTGSAMVTGLFTPSIIVSSFYFQCVNDECKDPNTLNVLVERRKIVKKSQSGNVLSETYPKTNINVPDLDLVCEGCFNLMIESVRDRISQREQVGDMFVESLYGCYLTSTFSINKLFALFYLLQWSKK